MSLRTYWPRKFVAARYEARFYVDTGYVYEDIPTYNFYMIHK